jgi:hypothetical protein
MGHWLLTIYTASSADHNFRVLKFLLSTKIDLILQMETWKKLPIWHEGLDTFFYKSSKSLA